MTPCIMCQNQWLQDTANAAGSAGSPAALASSSREADGTADAAPQQHPQPGQATDATGADGAPEAPQQQQQQQDTGPDIKQEAAAAANPAGPKQQQQQPLPAGAYTQREEHLQRQEASGEIEFAYVLNDGQPINMIRCARAALNPAQQLHLCCTECQAQQEDG
jgi:hypothetical protein